MRRNQVIGATLLILALGAAQEAEARGRSGRIRTATIGSAAVVSTGSIATAATVASDATARPVKPVAMPTPPVRAVSAAESWCVSRRVVGTGTGFCLIN